MQDKPIKIGKNLRNLLLSQDETAVFRDGGNPPTRCRYLGEEYEYEAVTESEAVEVAMELIELLEKFDHKGFERWVKILLMVAAVIMLAITLGVMRI